MTLIKHKCKGKKENEPILPSWLSVGCVTGRVLLGFSQTQQGASCVRKGLVLKSSLIDPLKTIWETCLQIAGGPPEHRVLSGVAPHSTEKLCETVSGFTRAPEFKNFFLPSFLFSIFWLQCEACGIFVSRLGIEPVPLIVEAWSLNHWTTREAPSFPPNLGDL